MNRVKLGVHLTAHVIDGRATKPENILAIGLLATRNGRSYKEQAKL